jgi:hypothetical protein
MAEIRDVKLGSKVTFGTGEVEVVVISTEMKPGYICDLELTKDFVDPTGRQFDKGFTFRLPVNVLRVLHLIVQNQTLKR